MPKKVLILGATGRFGRHAASAFKDAGWLVETFDRKKGNLEQAAIGCDAIIAAWNPAYPDWEKQVVNLHAQVIAAAQANGADVIVPSNIYVYGRESPSFIEETTPHAADNPLALVRKDMERAYKESGLRVLFLRTGDFIDTEASGNWFDQVLIKSLNKGLLTYPGKPGIPHAWAYLPDLARAAVKLIERPDRPSGAEEVLYPGYTLSGKEIAHALEATRGRSIRVQKMKWFPLQLASPFWKMGRCLLEMRYLWDKPHQLDSSQFHALLPGFRTTAVEEALTNATRHLERAD